MSPLMTALLLVAALQDAAWAYRDGTFVNLETMEKRTPKEFYDYGVRLAKERRTEDALYVFDLILRHVKDPAVAELARFKRAETLWSGSRFEEAYQAFDDFLRLYPDSGQAQRAKQLEMESALLLAKEGYTENFLGFLPILKSSKVGLDLLRAALQRYPREPFSATYYFRMAKFLVEDEQYAAAEAELKFITTEYKDTLETPRAILLLGEIGLLKFDSIEYDISGLVDARRHFERFVAEAEVLSAISKEAAAFVEKNLPFARQKIAFINETEAEKEWETAEYYLDKGYPRSAKLYYQSIVTRYPQTTWAAKAKERLKELKP
jgi:outer membrane protein assembly factor BamD (BamD/ComL family)